MGENFDKSETEFSRRDLLRGAGFIGASALVAASTTGCDSNTENFAITNSVPPPAPSPSVVFPQPPVVRSNNGFLSLPMDIRFATNVVPTPNGPRNFRSRTINGTITPPTIRVKPGDKLRLPISNNLPPNPDPRPADENTPHHFNSFNMHTHGFHVSPNQDDVITTMPPNSQKTYEYDIPADHPSGHFWYHPHKHGATAVHLFSGMSGSIIIEGGLDNVPEVAAAAELVFNIQELQLGGSIDPATINNPSPIGQSDPNLGFSNEAAVNPVAMSDPYIVPPYTRVNAFAGADSLLLVNGQYQPNIQVRPGQVLRLRILNSTVRATAPLTISGGNNWTLLALDGLTLPEVRTVSQFTLAPANRADVLVRIDTPGTFNIIKEGFSPGGLGLTPQDILATIEVAGEPFPQSLPTGPLPVSSTLPDIGAGEVTENRPLVYNQTGAGGPENPATSGNFAANFTIDGVRLDSNVVNQTITLGSVIEWTLTNPSQQWHPHHIHIHPFQVVATSDGFINGDPNLPLTKPTWMDTIHIPPGGSVTLRQRFPDFPGKFVLHCHILVHEDIGMMQIVNLI